ncbi:T9SS type A sorting domain-containing protein [Hymenobacter monticola]|uniref:T9SS type A sorting domain-containing protein n=1 Tax=Hymenobacter monticola TaxID=1705399 RepID=A0ABY4B3K6_9BACT|nr:T9SS type A sorting domain-containing protein [Hymenobacter monticola]UOE33374.1 T9SS type A sorting domain-containing protein [Hymenobacter monticola]
MPIATRVSVLAALLVGQAVCFRSTLWAQQLDPTFHPPVFAPLPGYTTPRVTNVVRQSDGRYVVAGLFQAVDGHVTDGLARLLADGYVDTTFTYRPAQSVAAQGGWTALAVQADGKVLGSLRTPGNLLRVLPSGQPDASFRPALRSRVGGQNIGQLVAQPDGKLLLAGAITDSLGHNGLVRLLPTGQVDPVFNPPALPADFAVLSVALEPSGRMVYSRSTFDIRTPVPTVTRLLASGRVDSTFSCTIPPATVPPQISKVVRCPDGSYALAGIFTDKAVAHLTPTGAWDTAFPLSVNCFTLYLGFIVGNSISAVAVQPDGRILVAGSILNASNRDAPMARTLRTGGNDSTFDFDFIYTFYQSPISPAYNGNSARVYDLLVEPSGKVLVAGNFAQAGTVPHSGLARLLVAAPLAGRGAAANAAPVQVWPMPAHSVLNVQLPTGALPRQVALLDATGRAVLVHQPLATAFSLPMVALPAGLYVLRVQQADGSVASQRVVLE